ncbi:MAG: oxidoreductase [Bacteroidia bacterium]|nr:oxidoreductase [Bacteroidia bacterium]
MRIFLTFIVICLWSCNKETSIVPRYFSSVEIEPMVMDSTISVRAITFNDEYLFFGSSGHLGKKALAKENKFDLNKFKWTSDNITVKTLLTYNDEPLQFRAIAEVDGVLFGISIGNPARLYKINRKSQNPVLVYEEQHEKVFYDSMDFWNDLEGIAIGDSIDGCLSIIITRDGGKTWNKLSCNDLPKGNQGEGAFAASDTNIAIVGDKTWVATTSGRIYYSADKGMTWEVFETPIVHEKETEGIYSIDFYDELNGYGIGGDYTDPEANAANKILTKDGGKTWELVAQNKEPGYRSCVQYIPNREGKELVAVGLKGIDYSSDGGYTWKHLSDEGYYTIRFINENEAYAAGKGRISKVHFEE